jgi:hypothetical protein
MKITHCQGSFPFYIIEYVRNSTLLHIVNSTDFIDKNNIRVNTNRY